ncbi:MAG: Crp/Fnr family transcriptional regulator [Anaerolineales bacterium]|jgi:CRP-like cAMP-binding protein
MKETKLKALSTIEIFQDLTPQEVEEIDHATKMSTSQPGRVFYTPEETGEVLFLLKHGRVQLYRLSASGKKIVVATLEPGAIFGEMSLVGQGMHNTFAEALDACTLCVMSRADVERLILNKPKVAMRIMQAMANRLMDAESQLEDIAFKSITSRLANLLIRLTDQSVDPDTLKGYSHQDLAEMLGTYRETATQTLNDFKNNGWIEISRKQITILDREALRSQIQV